MKRSFADFWNRVSDERNFGVVEFALSSHAPVLGRLLWELQFAPIYHFELLDVQIDRELWTMTR